MPDYVGKMHGGPYMWVARKGHYGKSSSDVKLVTSVKTESAAPTLSVETQTKPPYVRNRRM